MHVGQRPISLEYQISLPSNHIWNPRSWNDWRRRRRRSVTHGVESQLQLTQNASAPSLPYCSCTTWNPKTFHKILKRNYGALHSKILILHLLVNTINSSNTSCSLDEILLTFLVLANQVPCPFTQWGGRSEAVPPICCWLHWINYSTPSGRKTFYSKGKSKGSLKSYSFYLKCLTLSSAKSKFKLPSF